MGLTFIGENVPELRGLPPEERRQKYLHAVGQSYKMVKTWLGLVCFLILAFLADEIWQLLDLEKLPHETGRFVYLVIFTAALMVLGKAQISAIRDVLKKEKSQSNSAYRPTGSG